MTPDVALIVFLRYPQKGKVKTRLAASLGQGKALEVYLALIAHTLETARASGFRVYLYYEGGLPDHKDKLPYFSYHNQSEGSLGDRITHAIDHTLKNHQKAIIIGSDCPGLAADHIREAASALNNCDIVLGPALDGGYYLIGCKNLNHEIFRDIRWSTSQVLQQTIEAIKKNNLTFHLLETLRDIDTLEDLRESKF